MRPTMILSMALALLVGCASPPSAPGGRPTITKSYPAETRPLRWVWIEGRNLNGEVVQVFWTGDVQSRHLTTDGKGWKIHVEVPTGAKTGPMTVRVDGVDSNRGQIKILPPRRRQYP